MVAHWQSENFSEPFEHVFSIESPHSPLTKQTVVSLKPTITTNSHQMFLLYSGVKTLHQKPSQLLLMQTLCLSVKFISNIPLFYLSYQTVFICTGTTPRNAQQLKTGCCCLRMPPSLHQSLSLPFPVSLSFHWSAENSSLWRKLSEPSLFPWHLSLSNQR